MPTIQSAKKALKVSNKRRARNRHYLALLKENSKALDKALAAEKKDKNAISAALSEMYSCIDTLEKKNILHKNNAARKKSAAAKAVAALSL